LAFNARQYIEIAFILLGGFTLVGQKMASLPSSKESEAQKPHLDGFTLIVKKN